MIMIPRCGHLTELCIERTLTWTWDAAAAQLAELCLEARLSKTFSEVPLSAGRKAGLATVLMLALYRNCPIETWRGV